MSPSAEKSDSSRQEIRAMASKGTNPVAVGVVGARGYSGLELCRLLLDHPHVELRATFNRQPDWRLGQDLLHDAARGIANFPLEQLSAQMNHLDLLFLATPADVSQKLAEQLRHSHLRLIDLSGGFRLPPDEYAQAYHSAHLASGLSGIYGLVPWQSAERIQTARLIANPGCYATSILLALLPLLKAKILDPHWIVADAKSGTSGAGRTAKEPLLLSELFGNFYPYKVGQHQHTPEITRYLTEWSGQMVDLQLTTHLLPVERGILSSLYARVSPRLLAQGLTDGDVAALVAAAYEQAYADYPLAQSASMNTPQWSARSLELKMIVGTPLVRIHHQVRKHKIYIFSLIDNLLKGAASQAVENLNIMNGWPVHTGLLQSTGSHA